MDRYYKIEIQETKEGQVVVSPTATYTDSLAAETAFYQSVAYNLQQGENLNNFLVVIMTEVGYVIPDLKKFYNFVVPEPEPETNEA